MRENIVKFFVDLATGAVTGACAVLAATNLDIVSPKALAIAVLVGAINGVINSARRYAVSKIPVTP